MEQNPGAELLSQRSVLTRYSQFSKAVRQVEPPGKLLEEFQLLLILPSLTHFIHTGGCVVAFHIPDD